MNKNIFSLAFATLLTACGGGSSDQVNPFAPVQNDPMVVSQPETVEPAPSLKADSKL